jgi:hypothetical protein|tara:strand:+ start:2979 stop:3107 length:129 start_codon:yes stop_codon:yes gene_type:complete
LGKGKIGDGGDFLIADIGELNQNRQNSKRQTTPILFGQKKED